MGLFKPVTAQKLGGALITPFMKIQSKKLLKASWDGRLDDVAKYLEKYNWKGTRDYTMALIILSVIVAGGKDAELKEQLQEEVNSQKLLYLFLLIGGGEGIFIRRYLRSPSAKWFKDIFMSLLKNVDDSKKNTIWTNFLNQVGKMTPWKTNKKYIEESFCNALANALGVQYAKKVKQGLSASQPKSSKSPHPQPAPTPKKSSKPAHGPDADHAKKPDKFTSEDAEKRSEKVQAASDLLSTVSPREEDGGISNPPEVASECIMPKDMSKDLWQRLFGASKKVCKLTYHDENGDDKEAIVPWLYQGDNRNSTIFNNSDCGYTDKELEGLWAVFYDWTSRINIVGWEKVQLDVAFGSSDLKSDLKTYASDFGACASDIKTTLDAKKAASSPVAQPAPTPKKSSKPAHGPDADHAKKPDKFTSEDAEKRSEKVQAASDLFTAKGFTVDSRNESDFYTKMDAQLLQLYEASGKQLTADARTAVKDVPEPTLESSLEDTKIGELPTSNKENRGLGILTRNVLCSCSDVFNQDYLPGQITLSETESEFKNCGFKLYQINQAASQFNGLESTGTHHSPLYEQAGDDSQGPTACSQSLTSWVKREQMYEDGTLPDSAAALLDALLDKGVIKLSDDETYYTPTAGNGDEGKEFYKNGYMMPYVLNAAGKKAFAQIMANNPTAYMSQNAVSDDGKKPFTFAFGAALSYQNGPKDASDEGYALNYMNIYPQYENILKDAKRISKNLGKDYLVIVHLTGVGQGFFGNPKGIHHVALFAAAKKLGLMSNDAHECNVRVIYHWKMPKGRMWGDKTTTQVVEAINNGFKSLEITNWHVDY